MNNSISKETGFTESLNGEEPKRYIVSPYPFLTMKTDGYSRLHEHHFKRVNREILLKPNHFIGGWKGPDAYYFDVVISTDDKANAIALALTFDQIAIWDSVDNREIKV